MYYRRCFYVIFILCFSVSLWALEVQEFKGKVVSIADGDTISVMHNGVREKIRLNGIDCPENRQAFGNRAKQFTGNMVFGKTVTIKGHGKDKYGRTMGDVFLPNGTCLNKELVKQGLAWWYRQYSNDSEIEQLEQAARSSNQGLWSDSNPLAPWDYRHNPTSNSSENLFSTAGKIWKNLWKKIRL
ncbi:MAG: thermonuclease family protein [Nitrospirota bacterium]